MDIAIIVLIIVLPLYFLPWIVAKKRLHKNSAPIFIVNLLGGWTVAGWVFCLIWAFTSNVAEKPAAVSPAAVAVAAVSEEVEFRVDGVSEKTKDGKDRQAILEKCKISTPVKLERDAENEYDRHAVRVLVKIDNQWQDVGTVPEGDNRKVSAVVESGRKYSVEILQRNGGTKDFPDYGLTLSLRA